MSDPDVEHFVANNPDSVIVRQMSKDKREIEHLNNRIAELQADNKALCEAAVEVITPALEQAQSEIQRLRAALRDVDRWLAAFIAAWDKSRDLRKPSEAPVALMQAIRQHSIVREALQETDDA